MVPTQLASHQWRKDGLQIADHIDAGVDAIYLTIMSSPSYDVIVNAAGYQIKELTGVVLPGAVNIALPAASTSTQR